MEFEFSVGEGEKHQVRFKYSRLTNSVKIDVDGNLVRQDRFWLWIPSHRSYEFDVGASEQHDVATEAGGWARGASVILRPFPGLLLTGTQKTGADLPLK